MYTGNDVLSKRQNCSFADDAYCHVERSQAWLLTLVQQTPPSCLHMICGCEAPKQTRSNIHSHTTAIPHFTAVQVTNDQLYLPEQLQHAMR